MAANEEKMSAKRRSPGRLERRHVSTRREILDAARELLLEVGPEELTLRQVAHRADFSPAALYTYFGSRDEIIASLLAESFDHLDAYLHRVPETADPADRIVQLAMAYMDFARDNPVDLRCILTAEIKDLVPESGRAVGLEAARLIGRTLREGVDKGVFLFPEGLSTAEMTYGLWALVHGMASLAGVDLGAVEDYVRADPRWVFEVYVAQLTGTNRERP